MIILLVITLTNLSNPIYFLTRFRMIPKWTFQWAYFNSVQGNSVGQFLKQSLGLDQCICVAFQILLIENRRTCLLKGLVNLIGSLAQHLDCIFSREPLKGQTEQQLAGFSRSSFRNQDRLPQHKSHEQANLQARIGICRTEGVLASPAKSQKIRKREKSQRIFVFHSSSHELPVWNLIKCHNHPGPGQALFRDPKLNIMRRTARA
jgi:hypothetical protein